jgi:uncharacterized protein YlxW (UPF0749 family)
MQSRGQRAKPNRPTGWRLGVPLALGAAGLLFVTSAASAGGTDLRPGRYLDLPELLSARSAQVQGLRNTAQRLQTEVNALTRQVDNRRVDRLDRAIKRAAPAAGLTAVRGPGLAVTLNDAPTGETVPPGTSPDLLVVHQQDIQAVVNALWAGGARAISLQGQRVVSITGIKCVGNTVVLHGVPYSPPYRIVAVGTPSHLLRALHHSTYVANYLDYVAPPYNLGWAVRPVRSVSLPPYDGPLQLRYAVPVAQTASGRAGEG